MEKVLPLRLTQFAKPLGAVVAAFAVGALFIGLIGQNPLEIYEKMLTRTVGTGYGLGQILFRATPLVLTGLAVAIPYKAGLFNIGGEGQALLGTFFCALVGTVLSPALPPCLAVLICLSTAAAVGGAWGALAGALRAHFGINEVISTIMLNFIALALVSYWLTQVAVSGTVRTAQIVPAAYLPPLTFLDLTAKSPLNSAIFLSLLIAVLTHLLLTRSRFGYELHAVGFNRDAAKYAGIHAEFHILVSMAFGGACAGLVAANYVLGYRHYYEAQGISGVGFLGIAVAMLANANPLGILLSSLLFGLLDYGGLTINADVPKEIFLILQAVVILFILAVQAPAKSS
jgi:simple sugar transport system permease protein